MRDRTVDLVMSIVCLIPVVMAGMMVYGAYFVPEVHDKITWDAFSHFFCVGIPLIVTLIYIPLSMQGFVRVFAPKKKKFVINGEVRSVLVHVSNSLLIEVERDVLFNPTTLN